jgi:hypothetical protein
VVRGVHGGPDEARLACRVTVRPASRWLGRVLARLAGLPSRASVGEGELRIRRDVRGEVWERRFAHGRIKTRQWEEHGHLVEAFGAFQLVFALRADGQTLRFEQRGARLGWRSVHLPVPASLAPRVCARVWADGAPHTEVTVTAPGLGLLCAYEGVMSAGPPA